MKRFMRSIVAVIVILGLSSGAVSAQTPDCDGALVITNTGPGSVNEITCVQASEVLVSCVNNINVVTNSDQVAGSGDATGTTTITGNATNENGVVVEINANCGEPAAATTTPVAPPATPPTTPTTGTGAATPNVAVLPNTASNPIVHIATIGFVVIASLLALSRVAVVAYRTSHLK